MSLDINYPYPVLCTETNDYRIGSLRYDYRYDYEKKKLIVNCNLNNECIKQFIKKGDMAYGIRVSCNNSRFRNYMIRKGPHLEIDLNKDLVNDAVLLEVFVVAIHNIKITDKSPLSDIYNDVDVRYHIGDYVAIASNVLIHPKFNGQSNKSFIQYKKSNNTKDMYVSTDEDGIDIYLSPKNFERYLMYQNNENYRRIIFYSITIPALNSALLQIILMENDFNVSSCEWLQSILRQSEFDWDDLVNNPSNVSILITNLFKKPINSLFDSLDSTIKSEDEYDD